MPTRSTPALDTMRTITGVGESDRSMFPVTTACAAAAPESNGRTSTSTSCFLKNPSSLATYATSPENTVGTPDDPTVGMTSENAWNGGRYPQTRHVPAVQGRGPDLSPRAGDCTSGAHARPQTDLHSLRTRRGCAPNDPGRQAPPADLDLAAVLRRSRRSPRRQPRARWSLRTRGRSHGPAHRGRPGA